MNVMKLFNVNEGCATKGDLGVEIECEGTHLPQCGDYWKGEHDGSLQGSSREFVLRKPLSLLGVYKAVKELDSIFTDRGVKLDDSIRTGVHVHVNMQKSSKAQLFNLITLWAIFEDVLLDRCGAYRKGNLFCYPLARSDNVFNIMMKAAKDSGHLRYFCSDQYRYCAVNVVSLREYGSLEFRAMRTPRDVSDVYQWAKLLFQMKEFSAGFENPVVMIEHLNKIGAKAFYDDVFQGFEGYLTPKRDLDKQINEGLMVASAIAYSSDWKDVDEWKKMGMHPFDEEQAMEKPRRMKARPIQPRKLFGDVEAGGLNLNELEAFVEAVNKPVEPVEAVDEDEDDEW